VGAVKTETPIVEEDEERGSKQASNLGDMEYGNQFCDEYTRRDDVGWVKGDRFTIVFSISLFRFWPTASAVAEPAELGPQKLCGNVVIPSDILASYLSRNTSSAS